MVSEPGWEGGVPEKSSQPKEFLLISFNVQAMSNSFKIYSVSIIPPLAAHRLQDSFPVRLVGFMMNKMCCKCVPFRQESEGGAWGHRLDPLAIGLWGPTRFHLVSHAV